MANWRRSTGKGWQMEGWINAEMNQQQSNKAVAWFSGSPHKSSDLFPAWRNYHSPPNYFPPLNPLRMSGCISFSCLRSKSGGVGFFCELLCNLVASECVHRLHRKVRGGGGVEEEVCPWRIWPGPRPALPWPSNCARILTTCVYSMHAQMADRFRGLLCFLSFCFLLVFVWLSLTS